MEVRLYNISVKCLLAILLSALFASCKDEIDEEYRDASKGRSSMIGFNLIQNGFQKPTTRLGIVESIEKLDSVFVLSMKKKDAGSWEQVFNNNEGNGIDILKLINDGPHTTGGEIWDYSQSSPGAEWEDGYQYKFRAFYPRTLKVSNGNNGEQCESGGFKYTTLSNGSTLLTLTNYRSAKKLTDNTDLLVSNEETRAYSEESGNDEVVALDMKHLLSSVSFSIRKKAGTKLTIVKLRMKNYAQTGSYDGNNWIVPKSEYGTSDYAALIKDFEFHNLDGSIFTPQESDFKGNGKGNSNKINNKLFYVVYKNSSNTGRIYEYSSSLLDLKSYPAEVTSVENVCTGILMIPQSLLGEKESLKIQLQKNDIDIDIQRDRVEAEIEFYFGDKDPGTNNHLVATIDLSANGKVPEWIPGVKYNYTIGVFEYQAAVDITIEDWTSHTYEEELK